MEAITIDGLKIPEISEKHLILDIDIKLEPNEHGHAKVTLRILDDGNPENEIKNIEKKIISIKSNTAGVLFKGYIEDANIIQQKNEHVLELSLITTSVMLDKCRRSNSFQKDSLTIEDVVNEAVKDDSGICEYIDNKIKSEKIGTPIIRYDESGWEFISRIASKYWMPVIVDETADKPTVMIGVKNMGSASESEFLTKNVKKKVEASKYLIRHCKDKEGNVKAEEYKCIEVTSYASYKIGMSASFEGISGDILSKKAYLDGGELVFKYVIGDKKIYAIEPFYNKKLHGRCLEGKVVKCENEKVKLQLDIDKESKKTKSENELFFFPWQPETGNLMYCMPEKDTVVSLYIGTSDEGKAIVINNLRKDKGKEIDKPDNRYFTTKEGKRLYYSKEEIGFSNDSKNKGKNYLSIADDEGINIVTNKKLCLQADGKIKIKSNRKVTAKAKKGVNIINGSSSINLNRKFNIYATSTTMGMGMTMSDSTEKAKTLELRNGNSRDDENNDLSKIEIARAKLFEEAIKTKSQSALNELTSWKDELVEKGVNIDSINSILSKPMSSRTCEEVKELFDIRNKIEMPNEETVMSKVITSKDAYSYLTNGNYKDSVKGCVARARDCSGLKTKDDYVKTFGLNYVDDATNKAPYLEVTNIQAIRFNSEEAFNIEMPFGGNSEEDLDKFSKATNVNRNNLKNWSLPFDGSAFTQEGTDVPGETAHKAGSPEYRADKPIYIEEGAAIFDIDSNGEEKLLGVYDGTEWILTNEGENWIKNSKENV